MIPASIGLVRVSVQMPEAQPVSRVVPRFEIEPCLASLRARLIVLDCAGNVIRVHAACRSKVVMSYLGKVEMSY